MKHPKARTELSHVITSHRFHILTYFYKQIHSESGQFRSQVLNKYLLHPPTFADVRREFRNECTEAAVSANNNVPNRVSYHLILQS